MLSSSRTDSSVSLFLNKWLELAERICKKNSADSLAGSRRLCSWTVICCSVFILYKLILFVLGIHPEVLIRMKIIVWRQIQPHTPNHDQIVDEWYLTSNFLSFEDDRRWGFWWTEDAWWCLIAGLWRKSEVGHSHIFLFPLLPFPPEKKHPKCKTASFNAI